MSFIGSTKATLTDIRDRDPEVTEAWESGHAALADEPTHLLLSQARKGNNPATQAVANGVYSGAHGRI